MSKYYLSNDIRFLTGKGEYVISPSSGTHMKYSNVAMYLKNHPGSGFYKIRNTSRRNDYVVSTPMKFVGNDQNIVSSFQEARSFKSPEEAYEYLTVHDSDIDKDIIYVIDENFARKKTRYEIAKETEVIDPLDLIYFEGMNTSERVPIPPNVKKFIYDREGGICPICGKPLYVHGRTIDHIRPLGRKGTNNPRNLRATHWACNRLKNDFLDNEYINLASEVAIYNCLKNPLSETTVRFFRAFVRGINRTYKLSNQMSNAKVMA